MVKKESWYMSSWASFLCNPLSKGRFYTCFHNKRYHNRYHPKYQTRCVMCYSVLLLCIGRIQTLHPRDDQWFAVMYGHSVMDRTTTRPLFIYSTTVLHAYELWPNSDTEVEVFYESSQVQAEKLSFVSAYGQRLLASPHWGLVLYSS